MTYKTIFKGHLEFGSPRSYDKVLKMYQHRVESYYKSDVLLNEEEIFDEASSSLNVPRYITQGSKKSWRNTISLLEYIAQFAVAGNMGAWMTEEGKILYHGIVEPRSDKGAVQAYLRGCELGEEKGKEIEAKEALSKAIEKFERHAQAYERRGRINLLLKNYDDAVYDFTKSIDLASGNPEPYYGRAKVKAFKDDLTAAVADLEHSIKKSIPLQSIYWKSRRLKAECLLKMKDHKGALLDLKFYSSRAFKADDPNMQWKRQASFLYGKSLLELDSPAEAVAAFDKALAIDIGVERAPDADIFYHRGIARKEAGKTGYLKDWQSAAALGSKAAVLKLKKK